MKITIKHKETEVVLEETSEDPASMRWEDQNKRIQETIIVVIDKIKELLQS